MAAIIARGKRWRALIERKGHPRMAKSFDRKADADQWAIEQEAKLLGTVLAVDRKPTVRRMLERYRDEVSPKRKGARWEVVRINQFLSPGYLGFVNKRADETTPDDVGRWRDQMLARLSPGSVRRNMGLLSGVFSIAMTEWRWCRMNPVKAAKPPPKPRSRKRLISEDEVLAQVAALGFTGAAPTNRSQEIAVAFLFALETGMRDSEIITLEWNQVHLKERYVSLSETKNGDSRDVPLSEYAGDLLKLMEGRDPVKVFTVGSGTRDTLFRRAREKAGLAGFTFHDSRHSAVTRLADYLDVLELAKMIGHRDLKSLLLYYEKPASKMAAKLPPRR